MKISTIIIIVTLVLPLKLNAQSRDRWDSESGAILRYDKLEHFIGCAGLYTGFRLVGLSPKGAFWSTAVAQFLWEVKDAIVPWEDVGFWGGEGFSKLDFIAGVAGGLLAYTIEMELFGGRLKCSGRYISLSYSW